MANPAEKVQAALQTIENEDEFEEFEVEGEEYLSVLLPFVWNSAIAWDVHGAFRLH